MVTQLRQFKKQYREQYYEQLENEKKLIEKHDSLVMLDHRVRKMQHQIKEHSEGTKPKSDKNDEDSSDEYASHTMIQLKDEIDICKQQRSQEERSIKQRLLE